MSLLILAGVIVNCACVGGTGIDRVERFGASDVLLLPLKNVRKMARPAIARMNKQPKVTMGDCAGLAGWRDEV